MSQIQTKFIADNAVTGLKQRLANDQALRARNAANNADISILKVNASDQRVFLGDFLPDVITYVIGSLSKTWAEAWTKSLKLVNSANTFKVSIAAPAALAADYSLELPADDGASGEVLSTNGSGVLSWVSNAGLTLARETFTLNGTDITNQFVTLANAPNVASVTLIVKGGAPTMYGASHDYTVTGAQLDFLNDLATGGAAALVSGDILQVTYAY